MERKKYQNKKVYFFSFLVNSIGRTTPDNRFIGKPNKLYIINGFVKLIIF